MYRIRNWSQYNASLKQRGSLTIWVSPEAVANWTTDELSGEPVASPTFTDLAIETMATVQAIYGFGGHSLFEPTLPLFNPTIPPNTHVSNAAPTSLSVIPSAFLLSPQRLK